MFIHTVSLLRSTRRRRHHSVVTRAHYVFEQRRSPIRQSGPAKFARHLLRLPRALQLPSRHALGVRPSRTRARMIQLREANARSSVSLIAPAHPPCRAPGAPDASDANRSRSRSDRLFTHTPPKTRDLAREIFSPKKSHLYGKSLSWRSSRARRRASSRAHLSVRGVPVQANPALIVCASARARPRQSHRTRQRTTRRRDATINRTNRAIFPRTFTARRRRRVVRVRVRVRPRGVRVAHLFVRARRVVRARAIVRSSHASAHRVDECRRAGAPVAPVASGRKPGVASGDAVATLIIPVTFPHSTRRERHERTHARRRTPTPRIASSPATRAFVTARVRRRGRVSVVSARRHSSASARVSARQSAASDAL